MIQRKLEPPSNKFNSPSTSLPKPPPQDPLPDSSHTIIPREERRSPRDTDAFELGRVVRRLAQAEIFVCHLTSFLPPKRYTHVRHPVSKHNLLVQVKKRHDRGGGCVYGPVQLDITGWSPQWMSRFVFLEQL